MIDRDLFVGCVAILAGSVVLLGGLTGNDRMMQGTLPQLLVFQFGPIVARIIVVLAGAAIIAIGFLVLPGDSRTGSGAGQVGDSIRRGGTTLALEGWNRIDEPEC